jgi:hypothetical protein
VDDLSMPYLLTSDFRDTLLMAGVPDDERHISRQPPVEACGEIVEDDELFTGIDKLMRHVAAECNWLRR